MNRLRVIVALMLLPAGVRGQGIPLSAHFGALYIPSTDRIWEAGFSTDRFTDHTKPSDSIQAETKGLEDTKTRHYAIRSTLGINSLYLMRSFHFRSIASIGRLGVIGGNVNNEPSYFFQNNFRHHDLGLDFVPVDHVTERGMFGAFASIDRWIDILPQNEHVKLAGFGSLDATGSNFYSEGTIRLGVKTTYLNIFGWQQPPQITVQFRKSIFVRPGEILSGVPRDTLAKSMSDVIANSYTSSTGSVRLPLHEWLRNQSLIPDIEVAYSSHSGLFLARKLKGTTFERMGDTFQTYALLWGGGDVALETYNDSPGNKDIGPTFGARIYTRWRYWGFR